MVKKVILLNSIDELSLSETTKNYLFRKFSSVDDIVKKGREIAFERRNSALIGRWERELVSTLDSAGFIRPANDFAMTFNAMHLYAEVYPEFQDSFATSIKKLSNEEYESFIGLTNHEIEVLKNLLSNRLDSRDRAIVYRRFGLEDGEMKALETIGKELFVSTYKIREALARNYRFFRRENILPPICSAPKSVNETAKKFADELKEIRRDPIFEKERYLTSELQSFLRTTPFRCSREYYEVAGLELSLCDTPIDKLELSIRSHNCLKRAMLFTIDDLLRMSPKDLMGVRNLGRKGVEEVLEKLRPYRS